MAVAAIRREIRVRPDRSGPNSLHNRDKGSSDERLRRLLPRFGETWAMREQSAAVSKRASNFKSKGLESRMQD